MSECKHRWVSGPRQWPVTCSDCGLNKSDVQINTLTAQRDELLAACEAMKHALQAVEDSNCYKYDLDEIIRLGRTTIAKVRQ